MPVSRSRWIGTGVSALLIAACAHRPPMLSRAPADGACRAAPGIVTWVMPDDPRDRAHLDRWCSTVGPPVLEPPSRDYDGPVDDLAIISWNVHVGGGDLSTLVARLTRGDFTEGRPVGHYVLLLQEAFRTGGGIPARLPAAAPVPHAIAPLAPPGGRRDVVSMARELGLGCVYVPSMRNGSTAKNGTGEDRGNAILSTIPLADILAIELPFEHQRRVAVAATLRGRTSSGRAWEIAVADVHLDNAIAWTRGGPLAARRRQAEALVEALDRVRPQTLLVAGDFNTWLGSDEPAFTRLTRAYPDSPSQPESATWQSSIGIGASLDHVFARTGMKGMKDVRTRVLPSRFGSDHVPLLIHMSTNIPEQLQ